MVRWLEFKAVAPNLTALEERVRDFDTDFLHERREQDIHYNFPDGLLLLRQHARLHRHTGVLQNSSRRGETLVLQRHRWRCANQLVDGRVDPQNDLGHERRVVKVGLLRRRRNVQQVRPAAGDVPQLEDGLHQHQQPQPRQRHDHAGPSDPHHRRHRIGPNVTDAARLAGVRVNAVPAVVSVQLLHLEH